jgi:CubicO group peptidase (beta-lactamase class C family)
MRNHGNVFLLLSLCFFLSSCSSTYLGRYALLGPPDSEDYYRFPSRIVKNAPPPFHFIRDPEQEKRFTRLSGHLVYNVNGTDKGNSLDDLLRDNGTTAFIVIKDNVILYERYFNGCNSTSLLTSFSVTKSFVSALIGAAIADGFIKDNNEPVTAYLPELKKSGFDTVTIKHLLSMSSGINYDGGIFPWSDKPKLYYWPDLRRLALSVTREEEPGRYFHYNNFNPFLLGLVLERATGKSVSRYFEEKIWRPLGMQYPASWIIDEEDDGFEQMSTGINARAIDFAKFGRLYLCKGKWNGRQVIPDAWVVESTAPEAGVRPHPEYYNKHRDLSLGRFFSDQREYYKYFWWGYATKTGYDFFAMGSKGQFIYVSPEKNIIIVRFGKKWGDIDWWPAFFRHMIDRM